MTILLVQTYTWVNEVQKMAHQAIQLPSLGLGYMAAVLRDNNIEARIMDLNVDTEEDLLAYVRDFSPEVVGFTCYTMTCGRMLDVIKKVRAIKPAARIVAGGVHCTYEYKKLLGTGFIDFIVRFEGDYTFLELCRMVLSGDNNFREIKGLVYREGCELVRTPLREQITDLDALPFPIIDMSRYINRFAPIMASRGCAFGCIYCAASSYWGRNMRYRSIDSLRAEIQLRKGQGCDRFSFMDDNLNIHKDRFTALCHMLRAENIRWCGNININNLDEETLRLMKDSGCTLVLIGIESGDPEVQKKIFKNVDLPHAEKMVAVAARLGIEASCGFMLYHYCDTPETLESTKKLFARFRELGAHPGIAINTPFPGTYQYEHRDELGIRIREELDYGCYDLYQSVMDTRYFRKEEMEAAIKKEVLGYGPDGNIDQEKVKKLIKEYNIKSTKDITPEVMLEIAAKLGLYK